MSEDLAPLRKEIDDLDNRIIDLLARREDVVRRVAKVKKEQNISVVQSDRVKEVCDRNAKRMAERGGDPEFVRALYKFIIDYNHEFEDRLIQGEKSS